MLIPFIPLFERWGIECKGIVHCGASSGQERQYYASMGLKKVVWIEAIKEVYDELVRNIAQYPEQIALNACIGSTDGAEVTFNVSNNESQSSSFLQLGDHKTAHPDVHYVRSFTTTTLTLKTILDKAGIKVGEGWVLVADLQGAEMFMLKGAGDLLDKFNACYLEVNTTPVYEGCALKGDIEQYLSQYGFNGVEEHIYHDWHWGDEFFIKNK